MTGIEVSIIEVIKEASRTETGHMTEIETVIDMIG